MALNEYAPAKCCNTSRGKTSTSNLTRNGSLGMKNVRRSNLPFNSTPLGQWAEFESSKRFDPAENKPKEHTTEAPCGAYAAADIDNLTNRGRQ